MKEAILNTSDSVIYADNISVNSIIAFEKRDFVNGGRNIFILSQTPECNTWFFWTEFALMNGYRLVHRSVYDAIKWAKDIENVRVFVFDDDGVEFAKWLLSIVNEQ